MQGLNIKLNMSEASSAPIYQQLQAQLRDFIISGGLTPGARLPDVKTLATSAGVGINTAYRALDGLVKEGICCRRPKKGTFIAESFCPVPALEERQIVGLFHFNIDDSGGEFGLFRKLVFDGVSKEANKRGVDLFFLSGDAESRLKQYTSMPGCSPRGMLVFSENYQEVLKLAEIFPHMRFVIVNYYHENFEDTPDNIYGVFNDDFGGSYAAADRFIAEGGTHLGFINMTLADDNYLMRERGAASAAADSGITFSSYQIPNEGRHDQVESGYNAAKELFKTSPEIDVVMAANDKIASGICQYLVEQQQADKVRVCGYDRTHQHLPYNKMFSSIAIDFPRMGEKAIDLIIGSKPRTKMLQLFPQLVIK